MATKVQIKRTAITGRTPNTTNSGNSTYIDAGELAINLTDGKMFSSNGSVLFEVGSNLSSLAVTTVVANGSNGSTGQVLTSNGTGVYWSSASGVEAWQSVSNTYTATAGNRLLVDTSGGAFTITLPATPSSGDTVELVDAAEWGVNNLTVARNGSTIEGYSDDLLITNTGVTVLLIYNGTTWQVSANLGQKGSTEEAAALAVALG